MTLYLLHKVLETQIGRFPLLQTVFRRLKMSHALTLKRLSTFQGGSKAQIRAMSLAERII